MTPPLKSYSRNSGYRKNCPRITLISSQSKNRSAKSTFWLLTYEIHLDATKSASHSNHHAPVWETHTVRHSIVSSVCSRGSHGMTVRMSNITSLSKSMRSSTTWWKVPRSLNQAPYRIICLITGYSDRTVQRPSSEWCFNGSSPPLTGKSIHDLMHSGANLLLDISDQKPSAHFRNGHHKVYGQAKVKMIGIISKFCRLMANSMKWHITSPRTHTKAAPFLAVRALLQPKPKTKPKTKDIASNTKIWQVCWRHFWRLRPCLRTHWYCLTIESVVQCGRLFVSKMALNHSWTTKIKQFH